MDGMIHAGSTGYVVGGLRYWDFLGTVNWFVDAADILLETQQKVHRVNEVHMLPKYQLPFIIWWLKYEAIPIVHI